MSDDSFGKRTVFSPPIGETIPEAAEFWVDPNPDGRPLGITDRVKRWGDRFASAPPVLPDYSKVVSQIDEVPPRPIDQL